MIRPYPCTVVADRYNGTYSRGSWNAFPCQPHEVPDDPGEDDATALNFWGRWRGNDLQPTVGAGNTPDEAVADMMRRNP